MTSELAASLVYPKGNQGKANSKYKSSLCLFFTVSTIETHHYARSSCTMSRSKTFGDVPNSSKNATIPVL